MDEKRVLVLFSGDLDSMLVTCKIVELGYKAILIHYDNGASEGSNRVIGTAQRLIERYGTDKIEFCGIGMTVGYFKYLRDPIWNMKAYELAEKYPNLYMGQFNCLACRTAMYIYSILLCKMLGINKIAEGARKSQLFAIEQETMISKYQKLLNEFGIELLTPVLDLQDDSEKEVELMIRNITPKVFEPQCFFGIPMSKSLTNEEEQDVIKVYETELKPKCLKLIKISEGIDLKLQGKMF